MAVDFPSHRPSRSFIAPPVERVDCRLKESGVGVEGKLAAGIECDEMTQMAVRVVGFHVLLGSVFPLAQELFTMHRFRCQPRVETRELFPQLTEESCRRCRPPTAGATLILLITFQCIVEKAPHQLLRVCRGVLRLRSVFGRVFVGTFVGPVGSKHQPVHPIFTARLHGGQCRVPQIVRIERVLIVLPQVETIPGIGDGIVLHPVGTGAVDVVFGGQCPSTSHAPYLPRIALPLRTQAGFAVNIVEERQVQLTQIGCLREPVVHLHIDVGMDV